MHTQIEILSESKGDYGGYLLWTVWDHVEIGKDA
jgi:hypothetical protein